MDAAEHERHLRAHRLMQERHILDRLQVRPALGVDAFAAAEDRDGGEPGLGVDPLGPAPAVRLPQAPAEVGEDGQARLQRLVVPDARPSRLQELLEAGGVPPDREVGGQDQVQLEPGQLLDQLPAPGPDPLQHPVLDV